jgi:hypothetical protein
LNPGPPPLRGHVDLVRVLRADALGILPLDDGPNGRFLEAVIGNKFFFAGEEWVFRGLE